MGKETSWKNIIKDYKSGASVSKLTKKYSLSYYTINNYLIKNKVKMVKHNKISQEQIDKVIEIAKNGFIMKEIEDTLSLDRNTVRNIICEYNLSLETRKVPRDEKNKDFDDSYFENIDTENKAYFLGLIYADGNVRERNGKYYLNLELKREDKYIIEKLASELKCNNSIYDRDRDTNFGKSVMSSFITCNSKQIFDDLARFNIIPDKSHQTKSFKNVEKYIPENLIKHFLRGVIDGDGTISKRYTTTQNTIAVYQNEIEFCYDFDKLLKTSIKNENLKENIIMNKWNGVYSLRYRRINDIKEICDFLYNGANIYLERKYALAKLYFQDYIKVA